MEGNRDFINILKNYYGIEEQYKELVVHIKSKPYIVRIPRDATPDNVVSYRNLIGKKKSNIDCLMHLNKKERILTTPVVAGLNIIIFGFTIRRLIFQYDAQDKIQKPQMKF